MTENNHTKNNIKEQDNFFKNLYKLDLDHDGIISKIDEMVSKSWNRIANSDTINSNINRKEYMSKKVVSPKQAIQKLCNLEALKEAWKVFTLRKYSDVTISEVPQFHQPQISEPTESAKKALSELGANLRLGFIEEQIERAIIYNIPFQNYNDDYFKLCKDINAYEFLVERAKELDVDWDITDYQPIALRQRIEIAERIEAEAIRQERDDYRYSISV